MAEQDRQRETETDEVTQRNVAGMRELLERKQAEQQGRNAEPPQADDPHPPAQEDELAEQASTVRDSGGAIRNLGGGRP